MTDLQTDIHSAAQVKRLTYAAESIINLDEAIWREVSDTSRQFDEWCEKHGERDSHKAVPIAATPHRLIAAEVPLD